MEKFRISHVLLFLNTIWKIDNGYNFYQTSETFYLLTFYANMLDDEYADNNGKNNYVAENAV